MFGMTMVIVVIIMIMIKIMIINTRSKLLKTISVETDSVQVFQVDARRCTC